MFQTGGYMGKLNTVMEWIARFFFVQLIWILFCILGLIIGGIFPATFTLFAICRKWINKQTEFPLFRTFWNLYRASFFKANILGWVIVVTGFSLFYYLQLFRGVNDTIQVVLFFVVSTMSIAYLMTILFVIPVYVHFNITLSNVIKYAVITAISHPFQVISMAAVIAGFSMVMIQFPGLFPFFSFSLLAYSLMWLANTAFVSMERKASKLKGKNPVNGITSNKAKIIEI
ncbi:YesL family protein [Peribacillus loiseleuriae]|uniref:YesL family protein n=1 Tax=Peribacillus loiseleuriae TaxID=1679170 RepID=UPI003D058227